MQFLHALVKEMFSHVFNEAFNFDLSALLFAWYQDILQGIYEAHNFH